MKNSQNNTKNLIFETAINLFYEKGYEQVSVRTIAAEVGIKGSSIYNHFSSKQNILEEILAFHKEALSELYNNEQVTHKINDLLKTKDLKVVLTELLNISINGLKNPKLQKILKILSAEQLNIKIVREYFYYDYLVKARLAIKSIFDELNKSGVLKYQDTDFLANEFHAFIIYKFYEHYMLLQEYDFNGDDMISAFTKHIDFFVASVKSISN